MSFRIGDVDLGPAYDVFEDLAELEQAGYTRTLEIIEAESEDVMPPGVVKEARDFLDDRTKKASMRALQTLRAIARSDL